MNKWDLWPELTVKDTETGSIYIQTPDSKWTMYLNTWKNAYRKDSKTECPCPMPEGHVMFESDRYEIIKGQLRLC
jgi:hypothetical protein